MEENKNVNIDSTNIFDEFAGDEKLREEVERVKEERKKDGYYYLGLGSKLLSVLNTFFILSFVLLGGYIYIQNNEELNDMTYFDSICGVFVNGKEEGVSCASISVLLENKLTNYNKEKDEYFKINLGLIKDVYYLQNLIFSKDVSFLLERTENKMRPLDILEEFDRLKNEFEPINKSKIQCSNISIDNDYNIEMKCTAFSGIWEYEIMGNSGKNIGQDEVSGTSISLASSFINFLEKKENSNFLIIDKQKEFNFVEIVDKNGYTRKTDFNLKMKFNSNIIIDNNI